MAGRTRRKQRRNEVLSELREHLGLTYAQMGTEAGCNPVWLAQVETGSQGYRIGHQTAMRIHRCYRREMMELRLTLEDLLEGRRGARVA